MRPSMFVPHATVLLTLRIGTLPGRRKAILDTAGPGGVAPVIRRKYAGVPQIGKSVSRCAVVSAVSVGLNFLLCANPRLHMPKPDWHKQQIRELQKAKIEQECVDDRIAAIQRMEESIPGSQSGRWNAASRRRNPDQHVSESFKKKPPPRSREEVVDDLTGAHLSLVTV